MTQFSFLYKQPRWILAAGMAVLFSITGFQSAAAADGEPFAGQPVCLPGVYAEAPDHCLALGPSQVLSELASVGISYPPRALPAAKPDAALTQLNNYYARIALESHEPAPIYASLDDAVAVSNPVRYLAAGPIRYVTYIQQVDVNGGHYVQLASGEWMRASPAGYTRFQGLELRSTPKNGFGWILMETAVYSSPGYNSPQTGRQLGRENLVQVYAVEAADGVNWIMIGLDEWIEDRVIGRVTPNPLPPAGVTGERWIEINLEEQTIAVYEARELKFATLVTTGGEPFYTRPGLFKIYQKKEWETMSGSFEADRSDFYYLQDVPWTMYFDEARALHGAYWRTLYGYPGSHGCVNLSPGDSHWLFNWAMEGDWVYVWDPSGLTPTDPSLYGSGGA